jgi:hypothetical protein
MRAISGVFTAGIILTIAASTFTLFMVMAQSSGQLYQLRERSLGIENERGLEAIKAIVEGGFAKVKNVGPLAVNIRYIHYRMADDSFLEEPLNVTLRPAEEVSLPLNQGFEYAYLITSRGNPFPLDISTSEGLTYGTKSLLLPSTNGLSYVYDPDRGVLYGYGSWYGPFTPSVFDSPKASPANISRLALFSPSGKTVYTINFYEDSLVLKKYVAGLGSGSETIYEPGNEEGFLFRTDWGFIIALLTYPFDYEGFKYLLYSWNSSSLQKVGEYYYGPLPQGDHPLVTFNGSHIIELRVSRGTSSYRLVEATPYGLSLKEEGTFYIPASSFPSIPYVPSYSQFHLSYIVPLSLGNRIVICSMSSGTYELYITSISIDVWEVGGGPSGIQVNGLMPGLALLSEDKMLVLPFTGYEYMPVRTAYVLSLPNLTPLAERPWPITHHDPVKGEWEGGGSFSLWPASTALAPQQSLIYYTDGLRAYAGLYILRSSSQLAIPTTGGVELFDYYLNSTGTIAVTRPVLTAHNSAGIWYFLTLTPEGRAVLEG